VSFRIVEAARPHAAAGERDGWQAEKEGEAGSIID
jgi:hypothetical protein